MWNALPVDEAPPQLPPPTSGAAEPGQPSKATDGDVVEEIFESKARISGGRKPAGARNRSAATKATSKKAANTKVDLSDSESTDDSDDELASALISQPRGGGARSKFNAKKGKQ